MGSHALGAPRRARGVFVRQRREWKMQALQAAISTLLSHPAEKTCLEAFSQEVEVFSDEPNRRAVPADAAMAKIEKSRWVSVGRAAQESETAFDAEGESLRRMSRIRLAAALVALLVTARLPWFRYPGSGASPLQGGDWRPVSRAYPLVASAFGAAVWRARRDRTIDAPYVDPRQRVLVVVRVFPGIAAGVSTRAGRDAVVPLAAQALFDASGPRAALRKGELAADIDPPACGCLENARDRGSEAACRPVPIPPLKWR